MTSIGAMRWEVLCCYSHGSVVDVSLVESESSESRFPRLDTLEPVLVFFTIPMSFPLPSLARSTKQSKTEDVAVFLVGERVAMYNILVRWGVSCRLCEL